MSLPSLWRAKASQSRTQGAPVPNKYRATEDAGWRRFAAARGRRTASAGSRKPAPDVMERPLPVPARAAEQAGLGDRPRGHQRHPAYQVPPRVDPNLSEPLPLLTGSETTAGATTRSRSGRSTRTIRVTGRGETSASGVLSERRLRRRVHARRRDHVDRAVARQPPREEGGEIAVSAVARRAAEKRGVDSDSVRPRGGHLGPARLGRVARLDAEHAGIAGEQVVPGRQLSAAGDRRRPVVDTERITGFFIAIRASRVTSYALE